MALTKYINRQYRRYKYENRYDKPLFIFVIDATISTMKICLVLSLLAAVWFSAPKYLTSVSSKTNELGANAAESSIHNSNVSIVTNTEEAANSKVKTTDDTPAKVASVKATVLSNYIPKDAVQIARRAVTDTHPKTSDGDSANSSTNQNSSPNIDDEQWIKTLNPKSFVIQFGSAVDVRLFDEFIPLINIGEPIAIYPFKTTPSGRPVFGLATGVYEDLDAALAAITKYSAEARAYQPWARPVADIQRQIKAMSGDL